MMSLYGNSTWYGKRPAMGQESVPFGAQFEAVDKALDLLAKAGKLHGRYGFPSPYHQQQQQQQFAYDTLHGFEASRFHYVNSVNNAKTLTSNVNTFQQGLMFRADGGSTQGLSVANYSGQHLFQQPTFDKPAAFSEDSSNNVLECSKVWGTPSTTTAFPTTSVWG